MWWNFDKYKKFMSPITRSPFAQIGFKFELKLVLVRERADWILVIIRLMIVENQWICYKILMIMKDFVEKKSGIVSKMEGCGF